MVTKATSQSESTPKQAAKVYLANASNYQLDGWIPEQRQNGIIVVAQQPLGFKNSVHVTSDEKEIAFIEKSKAFSDHGDIVLCASIADAQREVARRDAIKRLDAKQTSVSEETRSYANVGQLPGNLSQPDADV